MLLPARTRFAPSPTGYMHVGGVRTALFAYLLAKQTNGQFILRIEDTDKKREVEGSSQHIIKTLRALGINYDEGPDIGGPFAPYQQSARSDIYHFWAQKLIKSGRAYADPYTTDQLEEFRKKAILEKKPFLYRNYRPEGPPEWTGESALRFKSDPKRYSWRDEVMGDLSTGPDVIDDFILIKSDGYPTYNFAHIVDDAEMKVTHIIRGQEFISSQPNYLNLYDALELDWPIFATMPHILAPAGNKKLGKRDGAKDALEYLKDGILPEALVNFIASLGWNDGSEQEIFSLDELITKYSLSRVHRSGARFDEKRLIWMNGQWIRRISTPELASRVIGYWPSSASAHTDDYKMKVLTITQDRLKILSELPVLTSFFFEEPTPDWSMLQNIKQLNSLSPTEIQQLIIATEKLLQESEFSADVLQNRLNQLLLATGQKPVVLFGLIRLIITWAPFSPGLPETMEVLGKDKVLGRIQRSLATLPFDK